jgi:hypothetical protein
MAVTIRVEPEDTWVARLQDAHGQQVVHALGGDFGRVALSQSEWLRKVSRSVE